MQVKKQLIVVGGPNGAGKTTFALDLIRATSYRYLSADAIAAELSPGKPDKAAFRAGRLFLARLREEINRDSDILLESTLSGRTLRKLIVQAAGRGFEIIIMFVFLGSIETCEARVRQRVNQGGHDVPQSDIERRYWRSISNFWRDYRFLVDGWVLHENSGGECVAIAYGRADNYIVLDEQCLTRFSKLVESSSRDPRLRK